jgi:hypothetical protein
MGLPIAAVPSPHCEPAAEHQIAGHVEEHHQQEPPHLDLEFEARLVLDVNPDQVEAAGERQQQDPRDALEEDEEEHGGHPTTGVTE